MGVSMQFVFLNMAGKTLFIRNDADRAEWTQEEMTLDLEFPFLLDKKISIGQRIFFVDPGTGAHQIYEVKQARTVEPDAYQQVTAEHICISELSDEHIDTKEIKKKTATSALDTILDGTLWSVGTHAVNPKSSVEISRGSKWQAVLSIKENWNIYIEPRVSLASDGTITRFLDIKSTAGEWHGVRLSIDKNAIDPAVIYDDSELYTALYGYGGTVNENKGKTSKIIDFSDVKWSATDEHPAKPKGKKYIENPLATQEFGRNGRARFGFYQNSDITDPETLLEKTWQSLKNVQKPKISIEGTVADLYRLGYADQPLKLHDIAVVEVKPINFLNQLQIIKMTVDLLDPSATSITIGSYIPNIIYYNKKTAKNSGGGGGGGNTSEETTWREFRTTVQAYQDGTGMRFTAVQNDIDNQTAEIAVVQADIEILYDKITLEVKDRREADGELSAKIEITASQIRSEVRNEISGLNSSITQTASQIRSEVNNAVSGLQSSITQTASQIRSEVNNAVSGLQSSITQNANEISLRVKAGDIASSINQTAQSVQIQAAKIDLQGYVTTSMLESAFTSAQQISTQQLTVSSYFTCLGHNASWQELNVVTSLTVDKTYANWAYVNSNNVITGHSTSNMVHGVTGNTTKIYYIGR